MATFEVLVRTIDQVIDHPNADRLSICKILGYEAITAKIDDGQGNLSHRFQAGDAIVYIPEATVIPEHLLRQYGYWDETKGKGLLAGSLGDRVKAVRLRGVLSQGLVWPTRSGSFMGQSILFVDNNNHPQGGEHRTGGSLAQGVKVGDDVAAFFGLTKYEPPVPMGMGGEVAAVYEFALDFDIENEQNFPGFLEHDEVEATEKLHGTNCRIAFRPGLNHDEMFGQGGVGITSKGMGAKGLMFKNNEANKDNLYVRTLRELGLIEAVEQLGMELNQKIDLFGEIYGRGVQDLQYGETKPVFKAFDIAVGGVFMGTDEKVQFFRQLNVERVPVLYRGPWDRNVLVTYRDGKTTLGGGNVKEGIVVTAVGDQTRREFMNNRLRPFLKMINPDYLTRKGDTTEFS